MELPFARYRSIPTLLDEVRNDRIHIAVTAQVRQTLLNDAPTYDRKLPQHLEELDTPKPCDFEVIQRRASCGAQTGRNDIGCVTACRLERSGDCVINLVERSSRITRR